MARASRADPHEHTQPNTRTRGRLGVFSFWPSWVVWLALMLAQTVGYAAISAIVWAVGGCASRANLDGLKPVPLREYLGSLDNATPVASSLDGITATNAEAAIRNIEARAKVNAALAAARESEARARAKGDAAADFQQTTKTVTGWMLAALAVAGVVSFLLSWTPIGKSFGLDAGDSMKALAGVAAVAGLRLVMLRYGIIAADWLAGVLIATSVVAALVFAAPYAVRAYRRIKDPEVKP